jgi:hypothetical protein
VGGSTVYRTKRRFVEGNLERALSEEPRPGVIRPFNCGLLSSALFLFLKPFGNAVALVPSERVELRRWGERGWQIDRQLGA